MINKSKIVTLYLTKNRYRSIKTRDNLFPEIKMINNLGKYLKVFLK